MQELKIRDKDGVTRCYGFDAYDGMLYAHTGSLNPGRPYRPIYRTRKADCFGIHASHAEFWSDEVEAAQTLAESPVPNAFWRGAY